MARWTAEKFFTRLGIHSSWKWDDSFMIHGTGNPWTDKTVATALQNKKKWDLNTPGAVNQCQYVSISLYHSSQTNTFQV